MLLILSAIVVALASGHGADDDEYLSLLQTQAKAIGNATATLSERAQNKSANDDAAIDHDLDHVLAGKGNPPPPPPRRRRRRAPTPSPTPACNGIQLNQFAGEKLVVSQQSTYWGHATYTYEIEIGGTIYQKTSNAGTYYLGAHTQYGDMVEYFRNGAKCGNTPRRADVSFTVGPTMQLVSAQETSMCVYVFTIQLPESKCGLPMTNVNVLDTNNDDGENENNNEVQDEANNVHECAKWCYSKKHKDKAWRQYDSPGGRANDPFKCGWFACSTCCECTQDPDTC